MILCSHLPCKKPIVGEFVLRCGACHVATYCNEECQKADWPTHQKDCAPAVETTDTEADLVGVQLDPPDSKITGEGMTSNLVTEALKSTAAISIFTYGLAHVLTLVLFRLHSNRLDLRLRSG